MYFLEDSFLSVDVTPMCLIIPQHVAVVEHLDLTNRVLVVGGVRSAEGEPTGEPVPSEGQPTGAGAAD